MKITGELLKSERIRLKLSQQDVSFALKLSVRTVNSIEEGEIDELPAKTFVRGFVKSYAQFLKLDEEKVLRQFQEEMGSTMNVARVQVSPAEAVNPVKKSKEFTAPAMNEDIATVDQNLKTGLTKNTFIVVGAIALGVIVVGAINHIINKYQQEGSTAQETTKLTVDALNQESNVEKGTLATTPEGAAAASTETNQSVDPSAATPAANATTTESQANTTTTATTTQPPVAAQKPAKPPTAESTPAVAQNTAPVKPAETAAAIAQRNMNPAGKPVEIIIEAQKDTQVAYSVDNKNTYKTISLKKDTLQIIKAKAGLYLKVDEGNAVNLTVNGINKGPASNEAKPIQLEF